ncbi:MAG: hypothetical protein R3F33_17490 [Planctomycetota bacterium]
MLFLLPALLLASPAPQGIRTPEVLSNPSAHPAAGLQSTAAVAPLGTLPVVMLTGYWPPTNEAVRRFSPSPTQNPLGWIGADWEGRGYDVYSYFPEFTPPNCFSCGTGTGDLEVDYQDTSADFWAIANALQPVAIITFSRGAIGLSWEVEMNQYNRTSWVNDYVAPTQPTPVPPDASVPGNYLRLSSLPVDRIVQAVTQANLGLAPAVCYSGNGGGFVSEFIAYHGVWYKELHDDAGDPTPCYAAGHIHVGTQVSWPVAEEAVKISLREVLLKVDCARSGNPCDTWCDPMDANSTGFPTVLAGSWTAPGGSNLHLRASSGPPDQFGYFLVGNEHSLQGVPISQGRLCLGTGAGAILSRYNVVGTVMDSLGQFDATGTFVNLSGTSSTGTGFDVPMALPYLAGSIQAGQTWHFQLWHREDMGQANFSNALSVNF